MSRRLKWERADESWAWVVMAGGCLRGLLRVHQGPFMPGGTGVELNPRSGGLEMGFRKLGGNGRGSGRHGAPQPIGSRVDAADFFRKKSVTMRAISGSNPKAPSRPRECDFSSMFS